MNTYQLRWAALRHAVEVAANDEGRRNNGEHSLRDTLLVMDKVEHLLEDRYDDEPSDESKCATPWQVPSSIIRIAGEWGGVTLEMGRDKYRGRYVNVCAVNPGGVKVEKGLRVPEGERLSDVVEAAARDVLNNKAHE